MEITVSFPGGKKVNTDIGGHTISTDQPIQYGGTGTAPAPFDYFLASIATCAGFYALDFILQRNLPTEGLSLTMKLEKDPEKKKISKIILDVTTPKGFPAKYTEALTRSVNLCAVKRHIAEPPEFETHVKLME